MLRINKGQAITIAYLTSMVTEYGYTRVDRIERTGEFSLRGDVFDIWARREKHPTRIMFFGDEIEQIKSISVTDFATIKPLSNTRILPIDNYVFIKRNVGNLTLPPRTNPVREQFLSKFNPDTSIGSLVYHMERGLGRYIGTKTLDLGTRKREYYIVQYSKSSMLYVPIDQSDMLYNYCGNARRLDKI